MIVTIEYELPDDEEEYKAAVFGLSMHRALKRIEKFLRDEMKYGMQNSSEHYVEMFYDILNDEGVNLD